MTLSAIVVLNTLWEPCQCATRIKWYIKELCQILLESILIPSKLMDLDSFAYLITPEHLY